MSLGELWEQGNPAQRIAIVLAVLVVAGVIAVVLCWFVFAVAWLIVAAVGAVVSLFV